MNASAAYIFRAHAVTSGFFSYRSAAVSIDNPVPKCGPPPAEAGAPFGGTSPACGDRVAPGSEVIEDLVEVVADRL